MPLTPHNKTKAILTLTPGPTEGEERTEQIILVPAIMDTKDNVIQQGRGGI